MVHEDSKCPAARLLKPLPQQLTCSCHARTMAMTPPHSFLPI